MRQQFQLVMAVCAFIFGVTGCGAQTQPNAETPTNANLAHNVALNNDVAPLTLAPPAGLTVDNYDKGLFSGAFVDKNGSTFTLKTVPHADGKLGSYLRGDFNIVKDGNAGFWNIPGMAWDNKQDWSKATALSFLAWSSKPMNLRFVIKGDAERTYETTAKLSGGKWETISLPVRDWTNVATGIGVVGGFDVHLETTGSGAFAIDEMHIEGGTTTGQFGQKVELDPKVIFAKSLTPPMQRSHQTYIVDANAGNDANVGSAAKPFKSIQKAATMVLPGDTVLVKNGVYNEENGAPGQAGIAITRSGAPDAWIRFANFPGQHPQVRTKTWAAFSVKEAAYVSIAGFDISTGVNPTEKKNVGTGVGMEHAHHIRVLDNTVHDCGGGGIASSYSDYLTIQNNRVFRNAFYNIYNTSGISMWEGRDFDSKNGFHNIIRANWSYRNENKGPTTLYGGKLTDGNGIIIDFGRGDGATLIENNICFANGGRGIHVFHSQNVTVRNNTCVGNNRTPDGGPSDLRANTSKNVSFYNNIVVGRDGQNFEENYLPENVIYSHNLFFGYKNVDAKTVGAQNIIGKNPMFVNRVLEVAKPDFRVQPKSAAIDSGSTKDAAPTDIEGRKRPQGKAADIGAYEQ